MRKVYFLFLFVFFISNVSSAQSLFDSASLQKIRRVGEPQISPDSKTVLLTIGDVNLDLNKVITQIYSVGINGSNLVPLTQGNSSNTSPRWSPDGRKIAFITNEQIWIMNADGTGSKQLTDLATGVSKFLWSPDGNKIAFLSDVYPVCNGNNKCIQEKELEQQTKIVKAVETNRLLYKHWNEVRNIKRTHIFTIASNGGEATEITHGDYDSPPFSASSFSDFAFSPDSQEIVYLKNTDKIEAASTNSDVYTISLVDSKTQNITIKNRGSDASPLYTPDGRYIVYRSQTQENFESDRWRLMRYDRSSGEIKELNSELDLQIEEFVIAGDSQSVYFTAVDRGNLPLFNVSIRTGIPKKLFANGNISNIQIAPNNEQFVFVFSFFSIPPEIVTIKKNSRVYEPLTKVNRQFVAQFGLRPPDETVWSGASKEQIHGYLFKPSNFDESKKYPLLVFIHGGPQSAWFNNWNYRWNPQVFANAGYVVFLPNPRGSVGYGQKFVNQVSQDWGGKAFKDISTGVEEIIKLPFVDKDRIGAAGASYGGYMINWMLGHNDHKRFRYKVFLSHAGIYNTESFFGSTEELWFPLWEFGGNPWKNQKQFTKWSPHKFAKLFRTPTMVTHGEMDYRVPISEGTQLFTALQLNNTDSKLLYFPDEGHWILKPKNSLLWYEKSLEWFDKYLKPQIR